MSVVEAEIIPTAISVIPSAAASLNLRQISFVDNYLECRVLWRAAELAGYSGDMGTLAVTANDLLKNPKVSAYYQERLQALHCSSDETLAEIGQIARSPWEKHVAVKYNDDGEIISAQLRLQDKLKALELAGKYHKLWDRTDSESNLTETDVNRLAESLLSIMTQAAERKRLEAAKACGDIRD